MDAVSVVSAIFTLLAGIGVFLVACNMMSSNLESAGSHKLKQLFGKASQSGLIGVGIGALGTAAIQSSGATTVMTIGFVNAGIISLTQAATIIYGANIGTTITAQIVALGMFGSNTISTTIIFSAFAGIGAFMMMLSKKNGWKTAGGILTGFGMLFVGLSLMSGSMADFAALDQVKVFLASISNQILLVLIGAIFTAIIQSSSVTTSIALAMVVTDLISLNQGIFLTMGSNIGSCVVAILAGVTSGKNAKRTSLIHLFFNCAGVIIFMLFGWILGLVTSGEVTFGSIFNSMFPDVPQTQLAMFHTFFNVITVVLMLPLTNPLVNLVTKLVPDKMAEDTSRELKLAFVDENMLRTPPMAVAQIKKEIVAMSELAMQNFDRSINIITSLDFSQQPEFDKCEHKLNFMNRAIVDFVVKLSDCNGLSEHDRRYLSTTYRSVRDLERVGDYAENIVEYAQGLRQAGDSFSSSALEEIKELHSMVHSLYDVAVKAYVNESISLVSDANVIEEQIDDYTHKMEEFHIKRMGEGICTPTAGAQYLEFSSNTERIADHLMNVAKSVVNLKP